MKILINENQLNFLLEQNSDLENRVFTLPINIINHLKKLVNSDSTKGKKRLNFLINEKKISYYEIKRIKNFLDKHDSKTEEYIQAGGEIMHKWVNLVLDANRRSIKSTKKHKSSILDNQFIKSHTKNIVPRIKAKDFKLNLNEQVYPITNSTEKNFSQYKAFMYEFKSKNNEFVVEFNSWHDDPNHYERYFYVKQKRVEYDLTKDNEPFSIYSTVANITVEFIKEHNPETIEINHAYEDVKDIEQKNRRGLFNYRALSKVLPSDYELKVQDPVYRKFLIVKKEKG